jgi:SAM-dependent methyltransferase
MHRLIGFVYRKIDQLSRPFIFNRQKKQVLARYPQLRPIMEAFEKRYIRVQYGAHDISLMERIQRKISQDERYIYGATPWVALLRLTENLEINPDEVFVELGCGTGHFCFFMQQVFGIQAIGIEALNTFILNAKEMMIELAEPPHSLDFKGLQFLNLDFMHFNFSRATLFYTAWTCFPGPVREQILEKFCRECKAGTRLLVLSHQLDDPRLELQQEIETFFSWGKDVARLYRKRE